MCVDGLVEVKELLGTGEEAKEARSIAILDQLAEDAESFSRARRLAKKLPPHMADALDREGMLQDGLDLCTPESHALASLLY